MNQSFGKVFITFYRVKLSSDDVPQAATSNTNAFELFPWFIYQLIS
jgi:hypothetical protein